MKTTFDQVCAMNVAFGNPGGDYNNIDIQRVRNVCKNLLDEYIELVGGLYGISKDQAKALFKDIHDDHDHILKSLASIQGDKHDPLVIRDALCDGMVFGCGAQFYLGVNGDDDMRSVIDGLYTRFIKNEADKEATIAKHAAAGVTDVYFLGSYPLMVMKSARDQHEAPKDKFLKSASFKDTVFPKAEYLSLLNRTFISDVPLLRYNACMNAIDVTEAMLRPKYSEDSPAISGVTVTYKDGHQDHWYFRPT